MPEYLVRVAEEIAMLDQLTGGRLIVFLLRGPPNELGVYNNIDPARSRDITEEAALLIRKALADTEPFAWKGNHFDFPRVSVWPGPTQKPHPPLYASGMSHDSVRFAARNRFRLAQAQRSVPCQQTRAPASARCSSAASRTR